MATTTETMMEPSSTQNISMIRSNTGTIKKEHIGRLRPTSKDTPLPEMKKRFEEDGYLFVKNLIPRADVLKVRRAYFEHYEPTGILEPGTSPEEGIFNSNQDPDSHGGIGAGVLPPEDFQVQTMIDSHAIPDYLHFLEHPALRQCVRDLMGWERDVLLQRTMLRHNVPGGKSTGIHYDKIFLRGGGAYFLTAWVPIGDIPLHGGGLIYLSPSTPLGRTIEFSFTARAPLLPSPADRLSAFNAHMGQFGQLSQDAGEFLENEAQGQGKWLAAEYEAGDVVFHDPYMIHGSSRNQDEKGRIRLSTDLRFYEEGTEVDGRWMVGRWNPRDGL